MQDGNTTGLSVAATTLVGRILLDPAQILGGLADPASQVAAGNKQLGLKIVG